MQTTLKVEGMTCGHCEKAVKGALQELEGVEEVNVHLESGDVEVSHNGVQEDKMKEAVEEQGYDVVS
ncbi:copper chaperone CopZ [Halobacillus sp. BBL2006]|uniref:copper chaperone CopZ n=1 Tax=Halobacillus sp. BBL2006 TaxID=1543706 RepID=UPI0005436F20|nr:copper chaperone CopZ [Halobacillus sp. BBL2006]KHE67581.1 copper-binding protein [Halobacillus sp. BBL2006]